MANPKLGTLADDFTGASINTGLWSLITAGAATLDAVNDQVRLAVPTTSGGINTFGTTALYDATGSSVAVRVGVTANGNGSTKSIMRIRFDSSNAVTMRVESGAFHFTMQIAGTLVTTTLPTYNPDAHRWWRLRESGGIFYGDASPDGLNWTNLASAAYSWDATNVTLRFESQAAATEVAGNVTLISNVNTRRGGAVNQNWPTVIEAWAPSQNVNGCTSPTSNLTSLTGRTQGQTSVRRGRQYELDQVQAGSYDVTLAAKDGALDPSNTASPWHGHIWPYQPYRKHAQWPPTPNLLTQFGATGGDLLGIPGPIPATSGILSVTDLLGGSVVTSTSAWQGTSAFQFNITAGTASGALICYTGRVAPDMGQAPVTAAMPVSQQLQVRNITPSTTLSVEAVLTFYSAAGAVVSTITGAPVSLTGSLTAPWTAVFVSTAAAPAGTAYMQVGVQTAATSGTGVTMVQVDGWQIEAAPVPSAWVCPGTWFPIYAGFVERWPSAWSMGGTYGTVAATAVDSLALLSQVTLQDPFTQEIQTRSPRFLYALGDPSGSTSATDTTGTFPAVPVVAARDGGGDIAFGTSITAAAATDVYLSDKTVATFTPVSSDAMDILNLAGVGITGPANTSLWSRMIAFRWGGGSAPSEADMWACIAKTGVLPQVNNQLRLFLDGSGTLNFRFGNSANGLALLTVGSGVADGNWHLAIYGYLNKNTVFLSLDGSYTTDSPIQTVPLAGWAPSGLISDSIGGLYDTSTRFGTAPWTGDLSYATEFPTALSASDCTQLYTTWRDAAAGESTDARYARILRYAGYTGAASLQPGLTTSMGPATDLPGTDAFSALQAVVDTENGAHFVARDGTITFQSRGNRYDSLVPVYTFGENTAAGEWPYEDCQLDYDPTHLANQVQVTQQSSNQVFSAQDAASIAAYFPRLLTRTVNASSAAECQDAAGYLVSRYKQPLVRVDVLKFHPSAFPALWPVCLSLELGMRVRVMRRPPAPAAPIQVDCFVESIQVDMDDTGEAVWTLQCSPVDPLLYGIFAAFHTTMTASSVGATSIIINAGQDNTNPAAAQLAAGQQLVLGQGSATPETVTIQAVGGTTAGWSTATLTLTAPTALAHAAGAVVCEPLPAGVTDPTTWDSASRFDSIVFAY